MLQFTVFTYCWKLFHSKEYHKSFKYQIVQLEMFQSIKYRLFQLLN